MPEFPPLLSSVSQSPPSRRPAVDDRQQSRNFLSGVGIHPGSEEAAAASTAAIIVFHLFFLRIVCWFPRQRAAARYRQGFYIFSNLESLCITSGGFFFLPISSFQIHVANHQNCFSLVSVNVTVYRYILPSKCVSHCTCFASCDPMLKVIPFFLSICLFHVIIINNIKIIVLF